MACKVLLFKSGWLSPAGHPLPSRASRVQWQPAGADAFQAGLGMSLPHPRLSAELLLLGAHRAAPAHHTHRLGAPAANGGLFPAPRRRPHPQHRLARPPARRPTLYTPGRQCLRRGLPARPRVQLRGRNVHSGLRALQVDAQFSAIISHQQPSAISHQPSAISRQPSAIIYQPLHACSCLGSRPRATSHEPRTTSHQPLATDVTHAHVWVFGRLSIVYGVALVERELGFSSTAAIAAPLLVITMGCSVAMCFMMASLIHKQGCVSWNRTRDP